MRRKLTMTGPGPMSQGQALFRYVVENTHEGIWIVDREAKTLYANEAMASMLGCTVEEMAGRSAFDFLFEEDLEKGRSQFADQLSTGEPAALDLRYRRKDGSPLWARVSTSPLSSGKRRPASWVGLFTDITGLVQAAQELHRGEEIFRTIAENSPDAITRLDLNLRRIYVNQSCCRLFGKSAEEMLGKTDLDLGLPEQLASQRKAACEQVVSSGQMLRKEYEFPGAERHRYLDVWHVPEFMGASQVQSILLIARDITEKRSAAQALAESRRQAERSLALTQAELEGTHAELRVLATKLISAEEETARSIARELHDDVCQRLAKLALELGILEQRIPSLADRARGRLRSTAREVGKLAQDAQRFSRRLHPSTLVDLGVKLTLQVECDRFTEVHGIPVTFTAERVPASLPGEAALCLYRIAQESLRNIARHAETPRVSVHLNGDADGVVLRVQDWGCGFDPQEARTRGGVGLVSMAERARLAGGAVSVSSEPGRGTTVEVWIPVKQERHEPAQLPPD